MCPMKNDPCQNVSLKGFYAFELCLMGGSALRKTSGGYVLFMGSKKKAAKEKVILLIAKKGWSDMSKNMCIYICKFNYDNVGYVIQLMDTNAQYVDYNELTSVFTNPTVSYRCGSTKILQHKL